jgi:hypothetical protein
MGEMGEVFRVVEGGGGGGEGRIVSGVVGVREMGGKRVRGGRRGEFGRAVACAVGERVGRRVVDGGSGGGVRGCSYFPSSLCVPCRGRLSMLLLAEVE